MSSSGETSDKCLSVRKRKATDRLLSGLCILRSHRRHVGLHEDPDGNRHRAETQKLANQPEPPDCLSEAAGRAA